ncbi:MAG: SGNH/GDSL hydrolase family protein [Acutalibacteraceae bacterium]
MKNILCFGDSNTFGHKPDRTGRYAYNERWTGILAQRLGTEYRVIEEGLNGRTTVFRDDEKPFATGIDYIFPCLMSHRPLDLVIVMLGTNDCKTKFHAEPKDIADGLEQILDCIQQPFYEQIPKVLILVPASIAESEDRSEFYGEFFNHYLKVSQGLAECYKAVAEKRDCYFLDINTVAKTSEIDGVHFDLSAHRQIAVAVEKKIREEIFPVI